MGVRRVEPGTPIGAARGEVVVCIPVRDAYEHFDSCLRSALASTAAGTRILVCDDASADPRISELVEELGAAPGCRHPLLHMRQPENVGFPANVNAAWQATAPADVVVLNSDCVVASGWLEGLREAADSDSRVATATALSNHGSIVSVPGSAPASELPPGWTLETAAAAVRAASLRIRPRLPTAIGHCFLIRRSAIELVGEFDLAFSPGYGEEVDFSQRCLRAGLLHVLADDVFVLHHGAGSFSSQPDRERIQADHEQLIVDRYPYYHDAVRAAEASSRASLGRALGVARRALCGLSVLLDARHSARVGSSALPVAELASALARTGRAEITVLLDDGADAPRADVVHRLSALEDEGELAFLRTLADRVVVTSESLADYRDPSVFAGGADWLAHRHLTRGLLAGADRVVFTSAHELGEALADDLLDPRRASVVRPGVDGVRGEGYGELVAPAGARALPPGSEVILCLGSDHRRENRLSALRLLDRLVSLHGWSGRLILAGPRVRHGSSRAEEEAFIAGREPLAKSVLDLGELSAAEERWLLERAALLLHPTLDGGFRRVPFEAAQHGLPCLWAGETFLGEALPDAEPPIAAWDSHDLADRVLRLLGDAAAREENLEQLRAAASRLSWDAAAAALIDAYQGACDAPAVGLVVGRVGAERAELSEDALRLVGGGGALPEDVQRPLLALATHPALGAPLFGALKLGYRISFELRRAARRRSAAPGTQRNLGQ